MADLPRQRQLGISPGTYDRLSELKKRITVREQRKVTFSELLDRMMKSWEKTHQEDKP